MRISKEELERQERFVNTLLSNVKVKVAYRYGYVALDLYSANGICLSTLVAGLTKAEAFTILDVLETIIKWEFKDLLP